MDKSDTFDFDSNLRMRFMGIEQKYGMTTDFQFSQMEWHILRFFFYVHIFNLTRVQTDMDAYLRSQYVANIFTFIDMVLDMRK